MQVKVGGEVRTLGKRIGRGGEGDVHLIDGQSDRAVKVYKEGLRASREPKVRAMVTAKVAASTDLVAFPDQIVTDTKGRFLGFAMRLVTGYMPFHELYSPKSRKLNFPKADYRFLIRVALNVARAVGKVHQSGCVIGDFNHSGVLVSQDATVALIDADSFQFTLDGTAYPCIVGVPDFTPPELHGSNLSTVTRTVAHDHFGLAVALFHLLAMGKHPYAGRFAGGDLTMSEAIAQNRFAFSLARSSETRTTAPPASISLKDFPTSVASAFDAAFGLYPLNRPTAAHWVVLLKELENAISHCTAVKQHYYPTAAGKCLWCRLADLSGVDMFPDLFVSTTSTTGGGPFDVERLAAQFKAIRLPLPTDIIPKFEGALETVSNAVAGAQRKRFGKLAIGALAIAAAVGGFTYASGAAIIWIGIGIFGLVNIFGSGVDGGPFQKAYNEAAKRARNAELAFLQRVGLTELSSVRDDVEQWISAYRQLDSDLNRELARLKQTREARQRSAYLDRFPIRRARITGIGPAKTATLASYGIETAADITAQAVFSVPGFGEAMTAKLVAWRQAHDAKFRYDPAPNAADAQAEFAARSAHAAKRADLQKKILSGISALQTGAPRIAARAKVLDQALVHALREMASAARELELLGLPVPAVPPIDLRTRPAPVAAPSPPQPKPRAAPAQSGTAGCPRCGSRMIRRTARRGINAGGQFWGCSRYPACTGTRK